MLGWALGTAAVLPELEAAASVLAVGGRARCRWGCCCCCVGCVCILWQQDAVARSGSLWRLLRPHCRAVIDVHAACVNVASSAILSPACLMICSGIKTAPCSSDHSVAQHTLTPAHCHALRRLQVSLEGPDPVGQCAKVSAVVEVQVLALGRPAAKTGGGKGRGGGGSSAPVFSPSLASQRYSFVGAVVRGSGARSVLDLGAWHSAAGGGQSCWLCMPMVYQAHM